MNGMMGRRRRAGRNRPGRSVRLVLLGGALAMIVGACGGGEGDDDASPAPSISATSTVEEPTTTAGESASDDSASGGSAAGEVPAFLDDFSRVCTTQVGFGGVDGYAAGAGPNPVVLFEEYREDGNFLQTSRTLPAGWAVSEDANFDDASELAAARLVACADQVRATPNGASCDFDSDGQPITLALVDTVYELTVYEAATGQPVGQATLDAATTECPFIVTIQEGDTQYMNEPTDDQYINALRPFVEG
jgi:hypothetical protein